MAEKTLIAVGVDAKEKIWGGHFGIAPYYYLYDQRGMLIEKRTNPYGAGQGQHSHHDNPQLIVNLLPECKVFIARRMGEPSKRKLVQQLEIETVISTEKEPQAAIQAYLAERGT
jgi:predicted Fe-Mo cluster-binding NifX family protein